MATGAGRWNESVEEAFFTRLAETGNVREAARAIGMSTTALYNRRKIWPAFDKCWDEVVTLATERLALSLLSSSARAGGSASRSPVSPTCNVGRAAAAVGSPGVSSFIVKPDWLRDARAET